MSEQSNSLRESRLKKLNNLTEMGINAYPNKYDRKDKIQSILDRFSDETEGMKVQTSGRIMLLRGQGKVSFANIKDDSGSIQIYVKKDIIGEENFLVFKNVDIGDIIGIEGEVFKTHTGEITIKVDKIFILSKSLLPLPEKFHGLSDKETRYRQRYLDLIVNNDVKEIFRKRSLAIRKIREILFNKDFLEVETPMMQPIYGGAAARPFMTHHNTLDMDLYLRIAPELYLKRLIVGGFERIFELNRNFRNEGISFKHNPEFTMVEMYQAYADYNDMMDLVEEIVVEVNKTLNDSNEIEYQGEKIDLTPPWKRYKLLDIIKEKSGIDFSKVTDAEAKEQAKKIGVDIPDDLNSKWKILDEVFKYKVEPFLIQPTIIYDYPKEISPLAKQKADNPDIVERFEPFIAGQEIGNAFSELNNPIEQKNRFLAQLQEKAKGDDEAHQMDEDYVAALEQAMPPTGGLGIGIDRVIMILLNQPSIRDVILFPQLRLQNK